MDAVRNSCPISAAISPFAAMRSMYVSESNADVSAVAWRVKDGAGWGEAPFN